MNTQFNPENGLLKDALSLSDDDWQELLELRRFWRLVDKGSSQDSCWLWLGCIDKRFNYGIARYHKKQIRSHRLSYSLSSGEIPEGMVVRHRCDNRRCCNPDHLELGTYADNNRDWQTRLIDQVGENNFASVLSEKQVTEIRQRCADGEQQKELATEFGVCGGSVSQIVTGWTWKHSFTGERKTRTHSKLTVKEMLSIQSEYDPLKTSQNKLARKYSVSRSTIRRVINGEYAMYLAKI